MLANLDIRFYLSIFLRRLPYFVAIVCLVSAIGATLAHILPPVYRASAKLLVEPPQISADLARSTVPTNPIEQVQIIEQQIMTRPNLLSLASAFNIYPDRDELTDADLVNDMRARAKIEPLLLDETGTGSGATAFSVSFDARNPDLAAKVANRLVDLVMEKNVQLRTDRAGDTLHFFQQEVDRLGAQLSEEERRILTFKNDNKDSLPDSLDFRRQQQSDQQERLTHLQREEAALRNRRANLTQFLGGSDTAVNMATATPEEQMLEQYRRSLVEQRAIFADTSASILALKARISALEDEVRAQRRARLSGAVGKRVPSETDMQFADIDGQLSFIADEKLSLQRSLAELQRTIAATPGNETVLNALLRASQNTQAEYNSAVARLATASTGEQIEVRSKGERLTLVEPAIPPQDPVRPNRVKIALGSVAAGFGLGLGFIVLLELMNKSIRRPIELADALEIESFGTVPYIRTRQEVLARRLAIVLPILVFVAAVPAAIYMIDTYQATISTTSAKMLFRLGLG